MSKAARSHWLRRRHPAGNIPRSPPGLLVRLARHGRCAALAWLAAAVLHLSGCAAPGTPVVVDRAPGAAASPARRPARSSAQVYVVQAGDTLYAISRKTGVGIAALVGHNDLRDPNRIYPGMKLRLSGPAPRRPSPATSPGQQAEATPPRQQAQAKAPRKQPQAKPPPARPTQQPPAVRETPARRTAAPGARTVDGVVWRWPTASPVVREYGGVNKGLDFALQPGAGVVSAGDGDVVYAGAGLAGFERLVIVRHNARYLSAYSVNQPLVVKEGQAIKGGQAIAAVRGKGRAARALHFEIRKNGEPISPRTVLR